MGGLRYQPPHEMVTWKFLALLQLLQFCPTKGTKTVPRTLLVELTTLAPLTPS